MAVYYSGLFSRTGWKLSSNNTNAWLTSHQRMAAYMTTTALTPVTHARHLWHTRVAAAAHPGPLRVEGDKHLLCGESHLSPCSPRRA